MKCPKKYHRISRDIQGELAKRIMFSIPFHSFPVSESFCCRKAQLVSAWHTLALLSRMDLKRGRKEKAERIDAIDA